MGAAPAFASVGEAMDMARAALGYLAAADARQLAAATQAECLRGLEQADGDQHRGAGVVPVRVHRGKGYADDADYSARAWLMHRTGITRGAAAAHTAWARRAGTHPGVVAALAAGELSESYGRTICQWTDRLPENYRQAADAILLVGRRRPGWAWRTCPRCPRRCTSGPARTCPMRTRPGSSRTAACGWRPPSAAPGADTGT